MPPLAWLRARVREGTPLTSAAVCAREEGYTFSNFTFRRMYRWLGARPQSINGTARVRALQRRLEGR
jgi:hypothetical protein